MACIAEESQDGLMRIILEKAIQLRCRFAAIFHLRFQKSQKLVGFKSKARDNLLKLTVIVKNCRQIAIRLNILIFKKL